MKHFIEIRNTAGAWKRFALIGGQARIEGCLELVRFYRDQGDCRLLTSSIEHGDVVIFG